jgi:hypothetical protein
MFILDFQCRTEASPSSHWYTTLRSLSFLACLLLIALLVSSSMAQTKLAGASLPLFLPKPAVNTVHLDFCHIYFQCTRVDRMLLGTKSGNPGRALLQTTGSTPKRLRDCKTLLIGNALLGKGSGYKDLCIKSSADQRTYKQ